MSVIAEHLKVSVKEATSAAAAAVHKVTALREAYRTAAKSLRTEYEAAKERDDSTDSTGAAARFKLECM
jgi:hypothetical protein